MQSEILVRHGTIHDLTSIMTLFGACFPDQEHSSFPFSHGELPDRHLLIDLNGTIIGLIDLSEDGYVHHLLIHPDFQRQGYGEMLLSMIEKRAKKMDLETIYIESQQKTVKFFQNCGYSVMVSQHALEDVPCEAGVILKKDLM